MLMETRLGGCLAAAVHRNVTIRALVLLLILSTLAVIFYSCILPRDVDASLSLSPPAPMSYKEGTPLWLRAYIDYHRTSLLKEQQTTTKYLRWVCRDGGCGGTGDRLSGIIQAFYMAMCTNRTLLVEWTAPDALQQYLEPRFIQWNAKITIRQRDFAIYAMDNKENIYLNDPYLLPVKKKLIELKTNVWRKEKNVTSTSCMKDYLSRYSDGTDAQFLYRKAFFALFQWSSRVLHHVSSVRRQIGL
jgi:hypothetical protein